MRTALAILLIIAACVAVYLVTPGPADAAVDIACGNANSVLG